MPSVVIGVRTFHTEGTASAKAQGWECCGSRGSATVVVGAGGVGGRIEGEEEGEEEGYDCCVSN